MVMATASALALSAISPAQAGWYYPAPMHGTGGGGAWIVGGIAISAASLIVCAAIVSNRYNRELTQPEAWTAAAIPLGCLLVPPTETRSVVRGRG